MYEPYVQALATHFQVKLPHWIAEESWVDNWKGSFWESNDNGKNQAKKSKFEHF